MKNQQKSEITKVIVILSSYLFIIGLVFFAFYFSKGLPLYEASFISTLIVLTIIFIFLYICLDYCFKYDHDDKMRVFYSKIIKDVHSNKENEHKNEIEMLKLRFDQKMLEDQMRNDHELKLKASEKEIINYHLGETFIKDAYRYIANGNGNTNMDYTNIIPRVSASIDTCFRSINNPSSDPNNNPIICINNPINNTNNPNTPNMNNTPSLNGSSTKADELKTANDMLKSILNSNKAQTANTPGYICLILNGIINKRKNLSKRKKR